MLQLLNSNYILCLRTYKKNTNGNEKTGDGKIYCHGSYSCYNCDSIKSSSTIDWNGIACYGLFSCSNVSYLLQAYGNILCLGEKSCFGSEIAHTSERVEDGIYCHAFMSCSNTRIFTQNTIYVGGFLGASNSIIYTTGDAILNFIGVSSGLNTKIICHSGTTCTLYCWSNACNNLTIECDETCTIEVICSQNGAEQSQLCPNGYNISKDIYTNTRFGLTHTLTPSLGNLTHIESNVENSYDLCFTMFTSPNATNINVHCQDYWECAGSMNISTLESETGGMICCTGYLSCYNLENITTNDIDFWSNSSDINSNIAIRCDGYYSCQDVANTQAINGGDIHFSGTRSGGSHSHGIISTTDDYDIICSGYGSCEDKSLLNANNIYCFGFWSCDDLENIGEISNIQNNVYMYAATASREMHFRNISGNVYCGTYAACYNGDFSNIGGFIYATSYGALYSAQISQLNESIIAFGYETLAYATISNIKNDIICKGQYCAKETSMTNVNGSVFATGYQSLSGAAMSDTRNVELKLKSTLFFFLSAFFFFLFFVFCVSCCFLLFLIFLFLAARLEQSLSGYEFLTTSKRSPNGEFHV